jgi:Na+-transporting methylmalonyl-CoA/oxaloacetate decarboxylase beta subunit
MKVIIIWILLIVNSLCIINKYSKKEAGAVGIIGRIDRKTAKFLFSHIDWYLVVMIVLDIVFITYLLSQPITN